MTETTSDGDEPVEALFDVASNPRAAGATFEVRPDRLAELSLVPDLFEVPETPNPRPRSSKAKPRTPRSSNSKNPEERAQAELAESLAKSYTRRVRLSSFPAVLKIVRKALEDDWTPQDIEAALGRLADKRFTVSANTLQYELTSASPRTDNRPTWDPKVRRGGKPVDTAVYRFYDETGVLLYVGQTPALIERFFEHRDDKPWFDEVARWSRDWHPTREEAEWREDFAIADEWPLYNIKGQPRDGDGYRIPSHVADILLQTIRDAVSHQVPEAHIEQIEAAVAQVADAFDVSHNHETDRPTYGMWFGQSTAPAETYPMDLDKAREGFGPYRPNVNGSIRVPRNTSTTEES